MPSRKIVVLAFDRVLLLDLAGPLQVFETSCEAEEAGEQPYSITVASVIGGPIRTSSGLLIMTDPLAAPIEDIDTLVIPGGPGVHTAANDEALVRWIAANAPGIRRVCAVCTGAFILGAAGLLSGRRAVTHWGSCDLLSRRFPEVLVNPDALYVHDKGIWTSAGVTAGIDLALSLVEDDRGHQEAIRVARRLVVFLKRPGGQAQFSLQLSLQACEDRTFESLHNWIQENISNDLKVEDLADHMGMSPRSFARKYVEKIGRTPARVLEEIRIEAVKRALESSELALKEIAVQCGFGDEGRMRRAFQRHLKVAPQDYRSRFSDRLRRPAGA
jgi:transcriptional regulator GlxA family with amidase domain